ncbi:CAP domain-containing protein [Streptomyces sp. NRRL WC-3742]|uniref:CAP domain-containing protein n=1 Tax=Streptomyces sp. NRRL WC-3742 TaxID=1463934 RepID=UPI0004C87CF6|nr:CAP domain-containing protein [Streptomyces sp. NRRL WC-3742]
MTFSPDLEQRMLARLNKHRRELGLHEVKLGADQSKAARDCVKENLDEHNFEHCGHEVLHTGPGSPEEIVDGWFWSPGHKQALTYDSSTYAGPAIGTNAEGTVIAAINIDY